MVLLGGGVTGGFQGPLGLHFLLEMLSGELALTIIKACYELPQEKCCILPD